MSGMSQKSMFRGAKYIRKKKRVVKRGGFPAGKLKKVYKKRTSKVNRTDKTS